MKVLSSYCDFKQRNSRHDHQSHWYRHQMDWYQGWGVLGGWEAAGNLSRQVTVRERDDCTSGNTNVFLVLSILIWNRMKKGSAFNRALYTNCVHHVKLHGFCSWADMYLQWHSNLKLTKYFKKRTPVTPGLILIIQTPFKAQFYMPFCKECYQMMYLPSWNELECRTKSKCV